MSSTFWAQRAELEETKLNHVSTCKPAHLLTNIALSKAKHMAELYTNGVRK
jgi:hypothetical protein